MICRPVLVSYYGGGTEGIRVYIQKLKDEFSDAMYMCGARKVSDIDGNFAADNRAYFKVNEVHIELYTDRKDLSAEALLEFT